MSVSINIVDNGLGVRLIAQGFLGFEDFIQANSAFFDQYAQEFSSCRYWLSDYSEVTDLDADYRQVNRLASMHIDASKLNPHLIVAIYCPADFIYGMVRMWETLAETTGWQIRVFRDMSEAKAWIHYYVEGSLTFA